MIEESINIDWTLAPDWAKHHAVDVSGAGFWYENQPHVGKAGQWINDRENEGRIMGSGYFRAFDDSINKDRTAWRHTLISLVEVESDLQDTSAHAEVDTDLDSALLLDFYNEVCDQAERNMAATNMVSGAHWNAMRQVLKAKGIEVSR